jgi:hypothetical protein
VTGRLRVLVSGALAGDSAQGGATWAVLQYVAGLRRLGHDVVLVEPVSRLTAERATRFQSVSSEFALDGHAALVATNSESTVGLPYERLIEWSRRADVLLNTSGMLADPRLLEPIPVRVYLDLDPGFNQLWHSVNAIDMHFEGHTHFATVGREVGRPGCSVPTLGRDWIPTLPPVVLELWPVARGRSEGAFTTVANWRSYGSIEHNGVHHGQKAHSLRRLVELPRRSTERFELALSIHPEERSDLELLVSHGWRLVDSARAAGTTTAYRAFIQASRAEIGIVKSGYTASRCGWFSDRSACYLASGRPVVAEDTSFSRTLPTGSGLLAFTTLDDAAAAIEDVRAAYPRHCRDARLLAEEHLDSDRVLGSLLERVGVA